MTFFQGVWADDFNNWSNTNDREPNDHSYVHVENGKAHSKNKKYFTNYTSVSEISYYLPISLERTEKSTSTDIYIISIPSQYWP